MNPSLTATLDFGEVEEKLYGLIHPELAAAALEPRERMTPSEWAARHVVLSRDQSAFPGPLDHRRAPYLAQLIDLFMLPGVVEMNVVKGTQVGVSQAARWLLGYVADHEPDPWGLALPDKEKGEQIVADRVIPFFEETPPLAALSTGRAHDTKRQQVKLANGFILYLMWGGSPSSMASNPMRGAIGDEVDKFKAFVGKETHGVHLISDRLATYQDRRRQMNLCSPTDSQGIITVLYNASTIKLAFLIDCPKCGAPQKLVWDRVRWEKFNLTDHAEIADRVLRSDAAWYECGNPTCSAKITDREKRLALQHGRFGTVDERGMGDGVISDALRPPGGRYPRGTRLGIHLSGLYPTWADFPKLAATFLNSLGDFAKLMHFKQSILGEPFDAQVHTQTTGGMSERCRAARLPEGVLPWWTARLLLTIDTQKDHFWWVLRAWGPNKRSARVAHGMCQSFEDLDRLLATGFKVEGDRYPLKAIDKAAIDSGGTRSEAIDGRSNENTPSRTMEVYAWAARNPHKVTVIKGDASPRLGQPHRPGAGHYVAQGQEFRLTIFLLDVHHYQDELAWLMDQSVLASVDAATGEAVEEPAWQLNTRDDPAYNEHMANLHKVGVRSKGKVVQKWRPRSSGARVDLRACEGYQVALADLAGVALLPDLEPWRQLREQEVAAYVRERQSGSGSRPRGVPGSDGGGGFRTPDGRPFVRRRQ